MSSFPLGGGVEFLLYLKKKNSMRLTWENELFLFALNYNPGFPSPISLSLVTEEVQLGFE